MAKAKKRGRKPEKPSQRKYSKSTRSDVKSELHRYKKGTAKRGRGHTAVKSRKQAIAIALSEARKEGKKAPKKRRS